MPKAAEPRSLTSLREKLDKIGAKVVDHGPPRDLPNGRGGRADVADVLRLVARRGHRPCRHGGAGADGTRL